MPERPRVLIYAAAVVLGHDGQGGACCVLQSGTHARALGQAGTGTNEQEAQVTICTLGLEALTMPVHVLMDINVGVVAEMMNSRDAIKVLARSESSGHMNAWARLEQVAARHSITWRHMRATDSPRMAAVVMAARELALAGEVHEEILTDAKDAVLSGRGLMDFSPIRQEMRAWGKV